MKKSEIKHLDLLSFKNVMENDRPTIIKFFNPKCHLCDGLRPIYDELNQKYSDVFDFAKLNVVKNIKIAKVFKIDGVPELFVVKKDFIQMIPYPDDDIADPISGYPKDYIIEHLEKIKHILKQMEE
jgi:thiol-disulfide isomerase/thioredoxin